jgi:predicted nucleotidyltransferase
VFGSVLRDDFGPNSDLDVLISFEPDREYRPDREAIRRDLEALVGRQVDVIYRRTLDTDRNYLRRRAILDDARTIYAAR